MSRDTLTPPGGAVRVPWHIDVRQEALCMSRGTLTPTGGAVHVPWHTDTGRRRCVVMWDNLQPS